MAVVDPCDGDLSFFIRPLYVEILHKKRFIWVSRRTCCLFRFVLGPNRGILNYFIFCSNVILWIVGNWNFDILTDTIFFGFVDWNLLVNELHKLKSQEITKSYNKKVILDTLCEISYLTVLLFLFSKDMILWNYVFKVSTSSQFL